MLNAEESIVQNFQSNLQR